MRLICPNCGAQYEVGADVIPDGGRDVQCSNCGHTWFENPEAPSASAEDDGMVAVDAVAPPAQVGPAASPPDAPPPPDSSPPPDAPPPPPVVRTQLDPSIADILREEAAREEEARRAEAAGAFEAQPDLGLPDPTPPPPVAARKVDPVAAGRERIDRLQGRAAAPTAAVATTGRRKELFPDIEEINSTLRSSADRDDLPPLPQDTARDARRSGWRGFLVTIALIVTLGLVYGYADPIATALPALSDPLAVYVDAVDAGRLWLDAQVQALLGDGGAA